MRCSQLLLFGLSLWAARADADDVVGVRVVGSSTLAGFDPPGAIDSDGGTAWCEGAPGDGTGESLTVKLATAVKLSSVTLRLDPYDAGTIRRDLGAVAEQLEIRTDDGQSVQLAPDRFGGSVKLRGTRVRELVVTFTKGARGGDRACIAEMDLLGARRIGVVTGLDAPAVKALPAAVTAIATALRVCNSKRLARWVTFPLAVEGTSRPELTTAFELTTECEAGQLPRPERDAIRTAGSMTKTSVVVHAESMDDEETRHDSLTLDWDGRRWRLVKLTVSRAPTTTLSTKKR
jgi:hypothetical protein